MTRDRPRETTRASTSHPQSDDGENTQRIWFQERQINSGDFTGREQGGDSKGHSLPPSVGLPAGWKNLAKSRVCEAEGRWEPGDIVGLLFIC